MIRILFIIFTLTLTNIYSNDRKNKKRVYAECITAPYSSTAKLTKITGKKTNLTFSPLSQSAANKLIDPTNPPNTKSLALQILTGQAAIGQGVYFKYRQPS